MLKKNEKSFNNTDYLFEKMNSENKNYIINKRKQKLSKETNLINYSDNVNNKEYFDNNKNHKSKIILLNYDIKNISSNSNRISNTANNSKIKFDYIKDNNKSNKKIILDSNLNTSSNYKNKKKNYTLNNFNLKSHFNSFNFLNKNIILNNFKENNKNNRYKSIVDYPTINIKKPEHFNSVFFKDRLSEAKLSPLYFHKFDKNINLIRINYNINRTFNKQKNKKNKNNKIFSPFRYSNNINENHILKQILKHPSLKTLYETNEIRARNMIRSHSKSLKKNLSLKKYQQNLVKNTLIPFDRGERIKIIQSFQKINKNVRQNKKLDLFEYIKEIQRQEKELVMNHNEIEEIYSKNIEKLGFSPIGKRKIHIEKMTFKDVFKNKSKKYKMKI